MPTLQLDSIFLLAPVFIIGAVIGYRRGWQKEAITAVGVLLAVAALWTGPGWAVALVNGLLSRLWRVVAAFAGSPPRSEVPELTLTPAVEPLVTLLALGVLVVAAYAVGNRLGRGARVDRAARIYGALLGGLNLFVILSRITGSLRQSGSPPGVDGLNIRIPSFPGLVIVVPAPSEGALLVGWPLTAIGLLLVSMLVLVLVRSART